MKKITIQLEFQYSQALNENFPQSTHYIYKETVVI